MRDSLAGPAGVRVLTKFSPFAGRSPGPSIEKVVVVKCIIHPHCMRPKAISTLYLGSGFVSPSSLPFVKEQTATGA